MNINDLATMQCPGCKSSGPFKIAATTLFTMDIHGAETFDDPEFDRSPSLNPTQTINNSRRRKHHGQIRIRTLGRH